MTTVYMPVKYYRELRVNYLCEFITLSGETTPTYFGHKIRICEYVSNPEYECRCCGGRTEGESFPIGLKCKYCMEYL